MSSLVVLPILVPMLSAIAGFLAWRSPRVQRTAAVGGALIHLAVAVALLRQVLEQGIVAVQVGDWPAPYGISLVADLLSAIMVLLVGLIGTAVAIYAVADIDAERVRLGFFPLLQVLLMGVSGAFLTGDLFNLYVFFEVMLIASFVLLVLGNGRAQLAGGIKYVTLNLLSSFFFLVAAGLLYGLARTLNMADLARVLPSQVETHPGVVASAGALLLLSFGIKAGVFPLYFWLPSSYHTPPPAVSAVFAGLLTKVGVYALIRASTLILPVGETVLTTIGIVAGATMLVGVIGAVSQFDIRRILGFHIISQIGYMVLGISFLLAPDPAVRRLALLATVFYITHHILVKTNLYLVGGVIRHLRGSCDLARLGGLARSSPWLAILFLIPALSLAGIPPLSGFWAKLGIISAGLEAQRPFLVAIAVVAGVLTLLSMLKIWNEAFWKPAPADARATAPLSRRKLLLLTLPIGILASGTLLIGLVPEPFFDVAARAADQLLDPDAYLEVVLESRR